MNDVVAQTVGHLSNTRREAGDLRKEGFMENIEAIRQRARQHIEGGAVSESNKADRNEEEHADELASMLHGMEG